MQTYADTSSGNQIYTDIYRCLVDVEFFIGRYVLRVLTSTLKPSGAAASSVSISTPPTGEGSIPPIFCQSQPPQTSAPADPCYPPSQPPLPTVIQGPSPVESPYSELRPILGHVTNQSSISFGLANTGACFASGNQATFQAGNSDLGPQYLDPRDLCSPSSRYAATQQWSSQLDHTCGIFCQGSCSEKILRSFHQVENNSLLSKLERRDLTSGQTLDLCPELVPQVSLEGGGSAISSITPDSYRYFQPLNNWDFSGNGYSPTALNQIIATNSLHQSNQPGQYLVR